METENNNTDKILRTLFSDVKTESAPNGFAERIMQQIAATNKQKTLIQEKDSSWWGILLIAVSSLAIVFAMLYFLFPDSIVFPEINWAENFNAFASYFEILTSSFTRVNSGVKISKSLDFDQIHTFRSRLESQKFYMR